MRVGFPVVHYPANATEEAAVPTGALVVKSGETEVKLKSSSGIESVATSSTVSGAVAAIAIKDWQASTAVVLNEVRRAPNAADTIEAGDLIRSVSARTTSGTFNAAEVIGNWIEFSPDIVTSVATRTGAVTLTSSDVGLANVNNTSDALKPVSTAQQTALDTKQATLVSGTNVKTLNSQNILGAGNIAVGASAASVTLHDNGVGGTISAIGNDRLHTLAGSGNFTVPDGVTAIQVLVVAGGGGGGAGRYRGDLNGRPGGGGGAGGLIYNAAFAVTAGALIAYAVGTGGAGATDTADTNAGVRGTQGMNSTFGALTAIGGGGGGGHYQVQQGVTWAVDPTTGGSGGGATNTGAGALGTTGQGNSGGIGGNGGGGGGGAGGVGGSGATVDAAGGIGTAVSITGSSVTYAVGGAGSIVSGAGNVGAAGTAGRGNGGGGGSEGGSDSIASGSAPGGAGGSGVIFVRYLYQSLDTPIYANNAAAIAGGLTLGQLYRAGADPDILAVVH